MDFQPIQMDTWARREHFAHYFSQVPCGYSMTVKLDITPIVEAGKKLDPTMLYLIARAVNRYPASRTIPFPSPWSPGRALTAFI